MLSVCHKADIYRIPIYAPVTLPLGHSIGGGKVVVSVPRARFRESLSFRIKLSISLAFSCSLWS